VPRLGDEPGELPDGDRGPGEVERPGDRDPAAGLVVVPAGLVVGVLFECPGPDQDEVELHLAAQVDGDRGGGVGPPGLSGEGRDQEHGGESGDPHAASLRVRVDRRRL